MTATKIEVFKIWLYERTRRQELKPADFLNKHARKLIRKQQENQIQ